MHQKLLLFTLKMRQFKINKKLIKEGDVHTHPVWRSAECAISSTRRIVRIANRYKKKAHVLHITTKEEIDFLSSIKATSLLR